MNSKKLTLFVFLSFVLTIFFLEDSVLDKYTVYQVSTVLLALLVPGDWVSAKFSKEISSNHTLCRDSIFVPLLPAVTTALLPIICTLF